MAEGGPPAHGRSLTWTPARSAAGKHRPGLVAGVISISAFMEVLDTAIANVALRHIAGSTASSYDQATWVLTSYLIANAIVIPLSGWLTEVIGRKRYYMISVALFSLASLCCGLAPTLTLLILARILQGIAGGGLQPVTQAMLVDTFPPAKRGQAMALFGLTVILAPTIGPVLGGTITDNFSWHWIFLINVPIGVLSLVLVQIFVDEPPLLVQERKHRWERGIRLDVWGALLIALALGALEITMDRGEREDWFSSNLIRFSALASGLSFIAFIVCELCRREPLLDMRLFRHVNFAVATLVIMIVGVILFGTTQFLPQLLQETLGYTATEAGKAMTLGGLATLIMMPLAGVLTNRVQPRILMGGALLVEAAALWNMTHFTTGMSVMTAAWGRVWQAIGIPFLFVPLTTAAYVGLPPWRTSQAAAMLNVGRNLGGTIGISLLQSLLSRRQQHHQSQLVETLEPLNLNYTEAVNNIAHTLMAQGLSSVEAAQVAVGLIYQEVLQQASMMAFIDCFKALMIFIVLIFPTVLLLRRSPVEHAQSHPAAPPPPVSARA